MSRAQAAGWSAARRLTRPQLWVLGAVAACWTLAVALVVSGHSDLISHDAIIEEHRLPLPLAIVAFLIVWQLMTGAMMLPSILPVVGIYARLARTQARPRAAMAVFIGAYFVVWTGFAVAALAGDTRIHWAVDHVPWVAAHQWLIPGALLIGAGVFQLTPLKERCLAECRNPLQFVWSRYEPGLRGAWRLGVANGLFCLGCCWALMLVMFGLGVGSVTIMAALGGIMVLEKTWRRGARLVPVASAALISLGVFGLVAHAWLATLPPLP